MFSQVCYEFFVIVKRDGIGTTSTAKKLMLNYNRSSLFQNVLYCSQLFGD